MTLTEREKQLLDHAGALCACGEAAKATGNNACEACAKPDYSAQWDSFYADALRLQDAFTAMGGGNV